MADNVNIALGVTGEPMNPSDQTTEVIHEAKRQPKDEEKSRCGLRKHLVRQEGANKLASAP